MTYVVSDESLAPRFEPAVRLTEILKSEPATEAALLRQAANDISDDCEDEIVTAHARPVARPLDGIRKAARRTFAVQLTWLALLKSDRVRSIGRRVHDMVASGAARFAAASHLVAAWIAASRSRSRDLREVAPPLCLD